MPNLPYDQNPLVAELVPDAGDPPTLVFLEGYLGRSSRAGHVRLYRNVLMDGWLDIPFSRVRCAGQRASQGGFRFETDLLWLEHGKFSGDGIDPVYPGGALSCPADSDLMKLWSPKPKKDGDDKGGGGPTGGDTKVNAPPFG